MCQCFHLAQNPFPDKSFWSRVTASRANSDNRPNDCYQYRYIRNQGVFGFIKIAEEFKQKYGAIIVKPSGIEHQLSIKKP